MRIATYNILKGGRQRIHWVKMIEDHSVDLLLVQESYPADQHLPSLLYPNARRRSVSGRAGQNGWGSAIYTKCGSVRAIAVTGFSGWVVGAEINGASWQAGPRDSILAFSVHVPSRAKSYSKEVNNLLDRIRRIARGREIIIGGDFNIAVSHWCGSDRPISKQDLAIQARLAGEFALMNCWQEANPNQALAQTLRWTGNRSIAYHCDGIFVPKSWKGRLRSCAVLAGDEWNRLSDHNPVVACFA
jgi:exonuclease III